MRRNKPRRRSRRHHPGPLHATIAERIPPVPALFAAPVPAPPPLKQRPALMPPAPRSARDVLALLAASTGFALAGCPSAEVELLPGSPVTVVIMSNGRAKAAFVLPISEAEACKTFGQPAPVSRDREMEVLWEEERHAC